MIFHFYMPHFWDVSWMVGLVRLTASRAIKLQVKFEPPRAARNQMKTHGFWGATNPQVL